MEKLILVFIGILVSITSYATDFSYTYAGNTVSYTIISEEEKTCMTSEGHKEGFYNTISGNFNVQGTLYIPSIAINGNNEYKVVSIGRLSFYHLYNITSVIIPETVTSIQEDAFKECNNLRSLTLGESVSFIESGAFEYCRSLKSLVIPKSVEKIGDHAFKDCNNLVSVDLSESSVTTIEPLTFSQCAKLTDISIPNFVTSIGLQAFSFCTALESVSIGNSVETIGSGAFGYCTNLSHVIFGNSLTSIYDGAFSDCQSLKSIEFPSSLQYIDSMAFMDCIALETIVFPESLTYIGSGAFVRCEKLSSAILPSSLTCISIALFSGCHSLESLTIPNSIRSIEQDAFSDCSKLKSIIIPKSVTSIGASAFRGCSGLKSIEIGNSVATIGGYAFHDCRNLISVEIPESVKKIGSSAFAGCSSLTSVNLSHALNEIADSTFFACEKLGSINIPDPIHEIGVAGFSGCSSLKSVILPGSLRKVGSNAFSECYELNSVTVITPIPPEIKNSTFEITTTCELNVPTGSQNIYWSHLFWGKFSTISTWGGNDSEGIMFASENICYRVTSEIDSTVDVTAFALTGRSPYIKIPEEVEYAGNVYRVTGIANNGFENVALSSISLPSTIGYVGLKAFMGCNELRIIKCLAKTPPSVSINSFDKSTYEEVTLEVPEDLISVYENDTVWVNFNVRTISNSISAIEINTTETCYRVGDEFTIDASVYPENASADDILWKSSDESIALVDENGEITVVGVGNVVITAACGEITSECALKCYPRIGDANWNGSVTIADAVDISNYVVKKKTAPEEWDEIEWLEFYTAGANANESEDGDITFADASAAVRIALSQPEAASMPNRIGAAYDRFNKSADALVIGSLRESNEGKTSVAVKLHNSVEYVALQADIFIPDGMDVEVKAGSRAASHSLETMRFDGNHLRVALFNLGNKAFPAGDDPVLEIVADGDMSGIEGLTISNILAADSEANEYVLGSRMADVTGVEAVSNDAVRIEKISGGLQVSNAAGKRIDICTMDGKTIKSFVAKDSIEIINLPAGIYIVKAGDKNLKVIL